MRFERLSPGMQDGQEAGLSAKMLGIGGDFEQRGGTGFEQQREEPPLVLPHQRDQRVRHAEDQVIVTHGQKFLLPPHEPPVAGVGLALRAVPVAAGVIGDGLMAATGALIAMSAQRSRAAACDRVEHLVLRPGQRCARPFAEPVACDADHVGHLEGWPRHLCRPSLSVPSEIRSSGLMAACKWRWDRWR